LFFPLGFGAWPRRFPFAIFLIVVICLAWSLKLFPTNRVIDREIAEAEATLDDEKISKALVEQTCVLKLKDRNFCSRVKSVAEAGSPGRQIASEDESLRQYNKMVEDFENEPEQWPPEAKQTQAYLDYKKAMADLNLRIDGIYNRAGYFTPHHKDPGTAIKATFTHGGWEHLLGNLLFLILVGLWVEQVLGFAMTGLLFLTGSFFGLYGEMMLAKPPALLGASAGITTLMGAFLAFFYKTEMRFLLALVPIYFRKISIPMLWSFPFFFLANDIVDIANHSDPGVAHFAHLFGLIFGFGVALMLKLAMRLGPDELYPAESELTGQLMKSPRWSTFESILNLNPQNWTMQKKLLRAVQAGEIAVPAGAGQKWLDGQIEFTLSFYLRRRPVPEVLELLQHIPLNWDWKKGFPHTPLTQVLFLADRLGQTGHYALAEKLYQVGLGKNPKVSQKENIEKALAAIVEFQSTATLMKEAV